MKSLMESIFRKVGSICVSWPWEVIFTVITLTLIMITCMDDGDTISAKVSEDNPHVNSFMNALIIFTFLYTINEVHTLSSQGSRCLHGIVVLLVVSTFICCSAVMKILKYEFSDLKVSICFSLLLFNSNLKQAIDLAEFALASSSYEEVKRKMEKGLARHGPSISLDALLLLLLLRCGILSEMLWLKKLSEFALMSVGANYIVLIIFYPAYLSLALEISSRCSSGSLPGVNSGLIKRFDGIESNPLVKSVKIIMSAGLGVVHCLTEFKAPQIFEERVQSVQDIEMTESNSLSRWLNEELVPFVLIVALIVFFILRGVKSSARGMMNASTQTSSPVNDISKEEFVEISSKSRSLEECLEIFKRKDGIFYLKDEEILLLAQKGNLPMRSLEETLKDPSRAVRIRRKLISPKLLYPDALSKITFENYDYTKVRGQCCENVIGYTQVPLGLAGPLKVNGHEYMIPMATTEGALVASTSRGCKALSQSECGVNSYIFRDGMTRAPLVQFPNAGKALEVLRWIKIPSNILLLKEAFDSTSNYAKLQEINPIPVNRMLFIRFLSTTGDAMGMNMVAKGTEAALKVLKEHFDEMEILSISGNLCTDKKPSAINWIMGRGKSVICDAVLPASVVKSVLKTNVEELIENNIKKNLVGSSMAGSIGGNNAHAANIVAAMFIACGQDTAQVVESSSCLTYLERCGPSKEDLYVSVTMPSLEVGTVGGGTILESQTGCLQILGVKGPSKEISGDNARQLAMMVASAVLAGELSLMASLTQQTLVKTHLELNRKLNSQATS